MDKKQIGHVVVLGSALVLNIAASNYAMAAATNACTDGSGVTIASSASNFVKTDFVTKCSRNTTVVYDMNATDFAVKSASVKGMHTFGGSTMGGTVAACENTSVASPAGNLGNPNLSAPSGTTPAGC